jgi:hypothetical protein
LETKYAILLLISSASQLTTNPPSALTYSAAPHVLVTIKDVQKIHTDGTSYNFLFRVAFGNVLNWNDWDDDSKFNLNDWTGKWNANNEVLFVATINFL